MTTNTELQGGGAIRSSAVVRPIHVVYGSTGEYSDRCEWYVAAYLDELKAQDHVTKAQQRGRELEIEYDGREWDVPDGANQYDPKMQMDYTGVRYAYATVPVLDWPNSDISDRR
jgi:hypothetical protein